jgi:putative endonuclease
MTKTFHVYILTNQNHTVLYTGVTSDLKKRVTEHKTKSHPKSFSARYNVDQLVFYEQLATIHFAIAREKQIKGGSRQKKIDLINAFNPSWQDLFNELT